MAKWRDGWLIREMVGEVESRAAIWRDGWRSGEMDG
jgi:hypothetical protein